MTDAVADDGAVVGTDLLTRDGFSLREEDGGCLDLACGSSIIFCSRSLAGSYAGTSRSRICGGGDLCPVIWGNNRHK